MVSIHTQSPSSLQGSSKVSSEVHSDFPACSTAATTNSPWPDDITPFSYHDTGEVSGLESFNFKHGWAPQNYGAQSMDIQISNIGPNNNGEQHRHADVDAYGVYTQSRSGDTQIAGISDEAMDIDLLATGRYTTSFSPTNAVDTRPRRDRDRDGGWSQFPGNEAPANPTSSKDLAKIEGKIKQRKIFFPVEEIQHRRMQELSRLAMDLYSQLANNDSEDHDHRPTSGSTTIAFQDQLIGSVLKYSNTFLTLLNSFSNPANRSSHLASCTPTSSTSYDKSTYDSSSSSSDTSPSSSTRDAEDHVMDEPIQHAHSERPVDSLDNVEPPPPIDTVTVLQLLTCYIRIVHLHNIMHAHILNYMCAFLQTHTPHVDSIHPIFPNMQVGGVSLNRFGTFQIRLLLQISVYMLGKIESALGLPKEYRVGKKSKGGRTGGVLGTSVSGDFLKCLMSEGAWRGKKVESVREQLRSVREQLRNLRRVLKRALDF